MSRLVDEVKLFEPDCAVGARSNQGPPVLRESLAFRRARSEWTAIPYCLTNGWMM